MKTSHKSKTLTIEWRYFERASRTCDRCSDTGKALRQTMGRLRRCLRPRGIALSLVETKLPAARLAESNTILFNGIPLETVLGDVRTGRSDCNSCGELIEEKVQCRTVERAGETFEAVPAQLICAAACRVVGCANCGCATTGAGGTHAGCDCH